MKIYITGDTHADFRRFGSNFFDDDKECCVIVCGDIVADPVRPDVVTVLTGINNDRLKPLDEKIIEHRKAHGDDTDMDYAGYCVCLSEAGREQYPDIMDGYMNLEYYKGPAEEITEELIQYSRKIRCR